MYWYVGGIAIGLVLIAALVATGVRRMRHDTATPSRGGHPAETKARRERNARKRR